MAGSTSKAPLGEQTGIAFDGYDVLRVTDASPTDNSDTVADHYYGSRGEQNMVRVTSGEVSLTAREADEVHVLMSVLAGYKPDSSDVQAWQGSSVDVDIVANQMNDQDDDVVRSWILIGANGPLPKPSGAAADYQERTTTLTGERILEFNNAGIQTTWVSLSASGSGWSGSLGYTPVQNPTGAYQQQQMYALAVQVATATGTSIKKWDKPPNCKHVKVTSAMVSSSGTVLIQQDDLDKADLSGTPCGALVSFLITGSVPSHTGIYSG